jgi:hypothetical protein
VKRIADAPLAGGRRSVVGFMDPPREVTVMLRTLLCTCAIATLTAAAGKTSASDLLLVHPGVDLAISASTEPDGLAVRVVVGNGVIAVDGMNVQALDDRDRVPAEAKRGSLITPLYDRLLEKADIEKELAARTGSTFDGQLLLAIAHDVPYATAVDVMYTAGQAQYGIQLLQVSDPAPADGDEATVHVIRTALPRIHSDDKSVQDWEAFVAVVRTEPGRVVVEQYPPQAPVMRNPFDDPVVPVEHAVPHLGDGLDTGTLGALLEGSKSTCDVCERVIIQPSASDPWQRVIQLLDATREHDGTVLFPRPVLARQAD